MNREVDLADHLPLYVQEYREIQGIRTAENPEFKMLQDKSETTKNNMFIFYTDEEGIERHEKMFGLTPLKSDSLQARQANVLAQHTNNTNYTEYCLMNRLDIICGGRKNYTLEIDRYFYEVVVYLNPNVKHLINTVTSMLANMLPANMVYMVTMNYNDHSLLGAYPDYYLSQFTHQELYNESVDYNYSATCDNITNYTAEDVESVWCEHILNLGMRKV